MRVLVVLGASLAVLALAGLAFADGGAPPERPAPGTRTWRPLVEDWSFVAASGHEMGARLCDDAMPCDRAALDAAAERGDACMLAARVWLSGHWGEARVVRDVSASVFVVTWRGNGELRPDGVINGSTELATFPYAWDGGWWWRAESERVLLAVPASCDAREVKATLQFEGRDAWGRTVTHPETIEVRLSSPDARE